MIERIRIQNFQPHLDTRLTLEQINAFIGPSDRGKSSILRALRWVMLNEAPDGDYVRWGATFVRVTVWIDGHKICRWRDKSNNCYELDGVEFRAFGRDVPEPIAKIFNTVEASWSSQHEPYYLFSLSPPEASRRLNTVVDLGVIDAALAYLAAAGRKAAVELGVAETRLATAEAKVAETAWVAEADADLTAAEQAAALAATATARLALVRGLATQGRILAAQAEAASNKAVAGRAVGLKGRAAIDVEAKAAAVRGLLAQAAAYEAAARPMPDFLPVERRRAVALAKQEIAINLRGLITDAKARMCVLADAEARGIVARRKLEESTGGLCPICGGPLKS